MEFFPRKVSYSDVTQTQRYFRFSLAEFVRRNWFGEARLSEKYVSSFAEYLMTFFRLEYFPFQITG
jgi:hypothetical protein